jgi:hypothetical protein
MPKFKVGDKVGRSGPLIPPYLQCGTVKAVIPNTHGVDWLTEYEVDFGDNLVQVLYETELKPAEERS